MPCRIARPPRPLQEGREIARRIRIAAIAVPFLALAWIDIRGIRRGWWRQRGGPLFRLSLLVFYLGCVIPVACFGTAASMLID